MRQGPAEVPPGPAAFSGDLLLELVDREDALTPMVGARPERMTWGTTGLHVAGRWTQPDLDVLLKVGVSPSQRFWSRTLSARDPDLGPRVLADGERLGGVQLGWVVSERLPGGLDAGWGGVEFSLLMDAGARFQRLSPALLIDVEACRMPWVFEAAYAQVLNSDPQRVGWRDMATRLASRRRVHGLPVGAVEDLQRAATIALAWYAVRMWGILGPVPDPAWRGTPVWEEQNRNHVEAAAAFGTPS